MFETGSGSSGLYRLLPLAAEEYLRYISGF